MPVTTDKKTDVILVMLSDLGTNDWAQAIQYAEEEGMNLSTLSDIASSLSARAAQLSAYIDMRGGYGTGDHGHDDAMKEVAKTRKRIRKALGYSYP